MTYKIKSRDKKSFSNNTQIIPYLVVNLIEIFEMYMKHVILFLFQNKNKDTNKRNAQFIIKSFYKFNAITAR